MGETIDEIAEAIRNTYDLKVSNTTVYRVIERVETPRRMRRAEVRRQAKKGNTLEFCAKAAGVSKTTAQRWCKDLGLKRGAKA